MTAKRFSERGILNNSLSKCIDTWSLSLNLQQPFLAAILLQVFRLLASSYFLVAAVTT